MKKKDPEIFSQLGGVKGLIKLWREINSFPKIKKEHKGKTVVFKRFSKLKSIDKSI